MTPKTRQGGVKVELAPIEDWKGEKEVRNPLEFADF